MRKIIWLTIACGTLWSTGVLAANWVKTPPNSTGMTAVYDADSVYVKSSDGLVYAMTCMDMACTTRSPDELFGPQLERVNCAVKSISYSDRGQWSIPALQSKTPYSMDDNEYQPETDAAMTVSAMCAHKASWPKH
jgi:hypothetical protein